ncbi:MAG: glycerophosphodiester phosphodiesterase [Senegalia sp. (in: firmicutes)]|uniref:glycerophosphodiester phosphodiesterase n=1 Tax=Senegalia sp. (in: firmicutes) TaxID=1924098 RepID=UPI003F943130
MKPIIYAHRGAKGYRPENTMAAFKLAMEMGADGIETDIHLSKDGYLVLIHDEKVDRTTTKKGYIKDMTLAQIKLLDAGSKFSEEFAGEEIPTLEELIILTKDTDIILNIEIKNNKMNYPKIEEKLVELIKKYKIEERVIISSFNHNTIYKIKELDENLKTGILYSRNIKRPIRFAKNIKADALHPKHKRVDFKLMIKAKLTGLEINTFTINNTKQMNKMFKYRVDGIITDYPDKAIEFRKRW